MKLPEINFKGRDLGYDEEGQAGWEDLKNTYFTPQCGGTDCVTLVRQAVPGNGSFPCVFLRAVPPRNPYYRGDTIVIQIQAPCSPTTDTSAGAGTDSANNGAQNAGQSNGGPDSGTPDTGQATDGATGGQDTGHNDGGPDIGGQAGSSSPSPS